MTSIADEIEKLDALRKNGAISEEEYQQAKKSLLEKHAPAAEKFGKAMGELAPSENTWSMFIHFSQFLGYVVPIAGLLVPIILWQIKKKESAVIDEHGRIVANWIITALIMLVVFWLLSFILIGIPLLIVLGILCIVFPIIGGIKAGSGDVWPYPFSIRFFK